MTSTTPDHSTDSIIDESYSLSPNQKLSIKAAVMKLDIAIDKLIEFDAHLEDEEQTESEIEQRIAMHQLAIELIIEEFKLR